MKKDWESLTKLKSGFKFWLDVYLIYCLMFYVNVNMHGFLIWNKNPMFIKVNIDLQTFDGGGLSIV